MMEIGTNRAWESKVGRGMVGPTGIFHSDPSKGRQTRKYSDTPFTSFYLFYYYYFFFKKRGQRKKIKACVLLRIFFFNIFWEKRERRTRGRNSANQIKVKWIKWLAKPWPSWSARSDLADRLLLLPFHITDYHRRRRRRPTLEIMGRRRRRLIRQFSSTKTLELYAKASPEKTARSTPNKPSNTAPKW